MKSAIVAEMLEKTSGSMTKADAERAFDLVTGSLKRVITRDGAARVPDLGTFKKKRRPSRESRNPRTGEMGTTAAKDVITFSMSKGAI